MNNIEYIQYEEFIKLTKKQKLEIKETSNYCEVEISRLLIIPTNKKNSGYCMGQFFAYSEGKGWWKPMSYDCWNIRSDVLNSAKVNFNFMILKGDFENGGFNIFQIGDKNHRVYMNYGGEIIIKNK